MTSPSGGPADRPVGPLDLDLVIRLPNWVGDVCMALPTITALADMQPLLFGRGWAPELLAGMGWSVDRLGDLRPVLHEKILDEEREITLQCCIPGTPPFGLLLTNSFSSAWQFRRAGLRPIGHRGDWRRPLLHRSLPRPTGLHEVEAFWRLGRFTAEVLGLPPLPERPPEHLGLRLSETHRAQADAALVAAGITRPYIALCPMAAGTIAGRSKVWPAFPLLCRLLVERGVSVVGCPGPGEDEPCRAALPGAVLLPGLKLGAYAAVLARSTCTVANDSGPMHLAAAVDAPVIGVFGVADPPRTRPWSPMGITVGDATGWPTVEAVWERLGLFVPSH